MKWFNFNRLKLSYELLIYIMKSHQDLTVYRTSNDLVIDVYQLSRNFPDAEKFGLTSQIRRAAVSIPSNIAEGAARNSKKGIY